MRILAACLSLIIGAAFVLPPVAMAATRKHPKAIKSMTVTLANGKKKTFHVMTIGGKKMVVAPAAR